ncbi:MAG: hypothetical protein IPL99_26390 [Candidatus Competibacteraceae bacterium]|nr:hypothetical protein [Candidatus Competibacteraceae bacterium]
MARNTLEGGRHLAAVEIAPEFHPFSQLVFIFSSSMKTLQLAGLGEIQHGGEMSAGGDAWRA